MEVQGKLIKIYDVQEFDSGFRKREFVVNTFKEQYPQDIKLELFKEKCEVLDSFTVGDDVNVEFNLRGNEYNGKYYVNLQAWRLAKLEEGASDKQVYANEMPAPSAQDAPSAGDADDDLPF